MNEVNDVIQLSLPAKPEFVSIARLASSGAASRMGFSFDAIEDIKVAVSEACTNAVNHGYKEDEVGQIRMVMDCDVQSITITVMHDGESFNANEALKKLHPIDTTVDLEEVNEGGLGLFLINTLMDRVSISTESGVAVRMTKLLTRDGVEQIADKVSTTD
ncbi:anti-sigma B factor RsbW [Sporolactobacillus terrae]|uniref:Anti-sigma B factor RsbW n=1 Tax=Sporolactobacillus terrae TaxID=269673 RepID=A0A410DBW0_9BACL|nr:anti-sigma B factor RsbW [Sporolactobacillus terrae]QAA23559.1 anti-sigma B factor RsbW [Sporolactobacillus terrae]QAA26529.1 anti-sigma B factor RsbW [Sporolactobacillus terrae]UAK15604.1 anti-sigma B factor RsbW [Sporolactobacillus terrae]BBO00063.1 serine-protein kinase RsbW [Sporolactobacillus terrae]